MKIEGPVAKHENVDKFACMLDDESVPISVPVYSIALFFRPSDCLTWGLLLRLIRNGPHAGCYERIGKFAFPDSSDSICDASKQTITLI
jgi:hypothetical protein